MGLSKKQKRRIQGYLDMLEYNSDVISLMSDDVRLDRIETLTAINDEWKYITKNKPLLNQMEKLYHKWHLSKMEIYNPK